MKTDTIFYQLFQTFPSLLFELIGESPEQAEGYEFSSREIQEMAFCFDGVFLPPTKSTNQPIYFVEVQFQPKIEPRIPRFLIGGVSKQYRQEVKNQ